MSARTPSFLSSSGRSFGFDRLHRLLSRYESSTSPSSITTGSTTRTPYLLDRHNNINGIENFWNQAKRTLSRYNGIPKAHFPLFLKEAEFRFNLGHPAPQTLGQTHGLAN